MKTASVGRWLVWLGACLVVLAAGRGAAGQGPTELRRWECIKSHDGVEADIVGSPLSAGFDLRYNFKAGAGFVIARHVFGTPVELPENFEITFDLSGTGAPNDLEVKLLDAGDGQGAKLGDSVWWIKRRNVEWPRTLTRFNSKAKRFRFAWGPLNGAKIRRLGGVEIVVASSSGGEGTIRVMNAAFTPLPAAHPYTGTPAVTVSSSRKGHGGALAVDGDAGTSWLDDEGTPPEFIVDFGASREFDALRIDWAAPVTEFRVEAADRPGGPWRRFWWASDLTPVTRSYIDVPDSTVRLLRVYPSKTPGASAGIAELRWLMRPEIAGAENLGVWGLIAADLPAAAMPRYFTARQSTWTVLGGPSAEGEALINEEGEVEPFRSGPMLSAVVLEAGDGGTRAVVWTGASQLMELDGVPTAVVERRSERVTLTTSAFAAQGRTHVLYTLAANGGPVRGELALCVRPFQVDPPWQFLNAPGGLAMVKQIAAVEHGWRIGERDAVFIPTGWTGRAALRFDEGEAAARLVTAGKLGGGHNDAEDEHGAASAAAVYPFDLQAGERRSLLVEAGPFEGGRAEAGRTGAAAAEFAAIRELQKGDWAGLDRVRMSLPPGNEQLVASVRASLAYILINKDGPGFQPGSRSYERSWMRDGALTSAALLEFGMAEEVKGFIEWYAGYQFPDGAVPCVVDRRGADPVVENDSHGQFVYALAEYHRFTGDDAFVTKHFGAAEKAVAHIQSERAKRMTAEYRGEGSRAEPGKAAAPLAAFYGLMPESISHEGYSAKPMHSYWDDFFTLKGLRDAAYLARVLKKGERAAAFASAAEDMAACIKRSIELTRRAHGIAYIPGCVELGDFDATSTTVAVNPCGVLNVLPREWVDETFERWWSFFEARRDGRVEWEDYTPYEWRIVGSLVTLGQRERAWEAAKWFMRDQNPARKEGDTSASGWLHWAEIVHKDRGAGKWIGDMPHTWVASDFLRSVRTMLVYEEAAGKDLVLFAGVPREWADGPGGVSFSGLRTAWGTVNASLKRLEDGRYEAHYDGLERMPEGGRVRLAPPAAWPAKEVDVEEGTVEAGGLGATRSLTVRFR